MKTIKFWFYAGVVFCAAVFVVGSALSSDTVKAIAVPHAVDMTPQRIAEFKADLVYRLLKCEAAGYKEEDAIVMYDNNSRGTLTGKNVWSFGQLQFKVSTIQKYVKDRTGVSISQKDAVLLALDTPKASELASWIIFETKGGIWNWKNCAESLGLPKEVEIIKKLAEGV